MLNLLYKLTITISQAIGICRRTLRCCVLVGEETLGAVGKVCRSVHMIKMTQGGGTTKVSALAKLQSALDKLYNEPGFPTLLQSAIWTTNSESVLPASPNDTHVEMGQY